MKISRNAPCPCGSKKKYKKCCLKNDAAPSQALRHRQLTEANERLNKNLLKCARRTFGEESIGVAIRKFFLWADPEDEAAEDAMERISPLFWPWFLFNWEYDSFDEDQELPGPEEETIAEVYAEQRGDRLNPMERLLIDSVNRKPYSFWEVLSVDKGKQMTLGDVLTGARLTVIERLGSQNTKPGDLLYGRAVSVGGEGMLFGVAAFIMPPSCKPAIIELRTRLRDEESDIDDDTLNDWDDEIRDLYFQIDEVLHAGPPKISNTDGDPMEFHRLVYDISSAQNAFEKLSDLCVTMAPEEMFACATLDDDRQVVRAKITWDRLGHKAMPGMPNTVLGRIVIDGQRLTGEVNSAQRAATLRREIESRLGDDCQFKLDEIQDPDSIMNKMAPGPGQMKKSKTQDELMRLPEVQEQLAQMVATHWEGWVDHGVPALGGKSPREAVKTADGREAVEALLRDAETNQRQDSFMMKANRKGAQRTRERLGLTPRRDLDLDLNSDLDSDLDSN